MKAVTDTAADGAAHAALVIEQFGPRAAAYVASADHAQGADLERLAGLAMARRGARALDLGCGGGHASFAVAPFAASVVAYDLAEDMLATVRVEALRRGFGNITTRQGGAEALPFPDASFDLVVTRFSAHHWRDLGAALAEMRRVVAPGGLVVVMDTISPDAPEADAFLDEVERLRDPSHVRDYSLWEWRDALAAAGLTPGTTTLGRLRLAFAPWVARIGTPADRIAAIRARQAEASAEVAAHFAIEPDHSFTIDTMMIEATP